MQRRKREALDVAVICLACLGALIWLGTVGRAARSFGPTIGGIGSGAPPALLVKDSRGLYRAWKESGRRGRMLVHASRFLHMVPAEERVSFRGLTAFPIRTFDLLARYEQELGPRNILWVALEAGIARRLAHLVPKDVFERKLAEASADPRASVHDRTIKTTENGSPRLITDKLPRFDEAVLLSIDASFLKQREPAEVLTELRRAPLVTDLVVLCRSDDNADVSPAERERLDALAHLISNSRP